MLLKGYVRHAWNKLSKIRQPIWTSSGRQQQIVHMFDQTRQSFRLFEMRKKINKIVKIDHKADSHLFDTNIFRMLNVDKLADLGQLFIFYQKVQGIVHFKKLNKSNKSTKKNKKQMCKHVLCQRK